MTIIRSRVAAIIASIVAVGLTGCGGLVAVNDAPASDSSQPSIRLVQNSTSCRLGTWGAVDQDGKGIYSVCVVRYPPPHPSPTYYFVNETDDQVLYVRLTKAVPRQNIGTLPLTQTRLDPVTKPALDPSARVVAAVAGNQRVNGGVLVPPGWYAFASGDVEVEISRDLPNSLGVAMGLAIAKFVEGKFELEAYFQSRSTQLRDCMTGVAEFANAYRTDPILTGPRRWVHRLCEL